MAQTINADNGVLSGSTGLKFTSDTTGILAIQNNGTTNVTVDASGNVGINLSSSISAKLDVVATTPGTTNAIRTKSSLAFLSPSATKTITANMLDAGTLTFEGSVGQLLTITDSFSGTIFSANDISGIPSIEVLDSGLIKFAQYGGFIAYGISTNLTATGTTQGTALALTRSINNVTTVAANTGVILPTPTVAGFRVMIRNGGADLLNVYPHIGGNIAGTGVNAAISLDIGTVLEFTAFDTTNWYLPSAVLT
jgi:hypothetical protein